jgi:hypothetical protein
MEVVVVSVDLILLAVWLLCLLVFGWLVCSGGAGAAGGGCCGGRAASFTMFRARTTF